MPFERRGSGKQLKNPPEGTSYSQDAALWQSQEVKSNGFFGVSLSRTPYLRSEEGRVRIFLPTAAFQQAVI